jgi:hypothetical protein
MSCGCHPKKRRGEVMPHKFAVGDCVRFHPVVRLAAVRGLYVVTMRLPERDGEYEYRIRGGTSGPHERIARESELRRA